MAADPVAVAPDADLRPMRRHAGGGSSTTPRRTASDGQARVARTVGHRDRRGRSRRRDRLRSSRTCRRLRATEPDVAAPRLIWHGSRTERVVALTFDDGWNARTLRQIYRVLVREHVPATFFVTGIYVQRAPGLWRQIAASGFPLANHSYLHRDARRLTARQMADDLARTRVAVEAVTGRPMLPYFRPP